ncbi:SRPBCC domain-containing protein [Pelagibius sp. CAU 1746]|uniref:SRPBCC domain-containing protein n=1 Tax=Pelagibius sp. CAU 1746 TaxID=3140370 RepID=UPI00325A7730
MAASPDLAREPEDRVLVITRVLDAPRALVFKVWTQPEHLVRWWGPKGFTLPDCTVELRPGGAFRCLMRSPEGTDHRMHGAFREIVEPEKVSFTWAWVDEEGHAGHETLVTVLLEEAGADGAQTKLTLHHAVFESESARDAHNGGWSECMERLAAYVAGL